MDCFPSQPAPIEYTFDNIPGQFEWNSTVTEPSNPDAPRNFSDDFMDSLLTSDQVSTLLAACEPTWTTDSFNAGFPVECQSLSDWELPLYSQLPLSSASGEDPVALAQPAFQPIVTGSTTYRNGFGDPIHSIDLHPYDSPSSCDVYSTPSAMPSSGCSPSDSFPGYSFPISQPPPLIQPPNTWNLIPSPSYSPSKSSTRSSVTSISTVPEQPIKKHRCQICGRAFQRQTTLSQHQITHTGERPYACPIAGCDKAFTTASNAKRHAKTHFRMSHGFHHSSSPGPF